MDRREIATTERLTFRLSRNRQPPPSEEIVDAIRPEERPAEPSKEAPRPPKTSARQSLLREMSSRRALRQAIIFHEVLGPPRSLRRSENL